LKQAIDWKPLDLHELFVWLIVMMIYAVRKTPRMSDMWSYDDLFSLPLLTSLNITYFRWKQIRKYFHVSPIIVPEESVNDRYFKVRYMKNTLIENSLQNIPCCKIKLDEMTIGYQGRTHLIKRTPSKKVSKAFQCVVALTTNYGYVLDFEFDGEFTGVDSFPDLSSTSNRTMSVEVFTIYSCLCNSSDG
jgi:hypothetical protein